MSLWNGGVSGILDVRGHGAVFRLLMNPVTDTACPSLPASEGSLPSRGLARCLIALGAAGALLPATPPWAALMTGATIAVVFGNPWVQLTNRLSKPLLQLTVVGLGAGVDLRSVGRVGLEGLGYTATGLVLTFLLGAFLARWLRVVPRLSALVSAGTAICGGSAIASLAPVIKASAAETSAAFATVFLLNGVALLIFPPLADYFGLSSHGFGLWCALAIHDTSSVTGAAMSHGAEALATATTVKLARALWIMPVALLLGWWVAHGKRRERGQYRLIFPLFIAGFVAVSAAFTFVPGIASAVPSVRHVSRAALTLTLFLIGAGLDRTSLQSVGPRAFLHGLLLWILVGSGTLFAILRGWIH